jgi:hypothetical protein
MSKRNDAIRPSGAKRSDVKKVLNVAAMHLRNSRNCGRKFMARHKLIRHKIVTTGREIDRAIDHAKNLQSEPRVTGVEYRPGLDLLILKLSDGRRYLIPREELQGLEHATKEQIAQVEILGHGTGLHWPALNLDLYVPTLLRRVYGTKRWMAEIGRRGGSAKSLAKKRAARSNGLKGGRPRQRELAANG